MTTVKSSEEIEEMDEITVVFLIEFYRESGFPLPVDVHSRAVELGLIDEVEIPK